MDGIVGAQYYNTGWLQVLFVLLLCAFIIFNIARAKKGKDLFIRRISGLDAIDEAVGRSTEMGKPVLMVPGLSGLGPVAIQALSIFAYVTRTAAKFGIPIRLCVAEAALYTVAQEVIRDIYQSEGVPERFETDSVRFISDRQFAFAAGVSGLVHREKTAAAFFLGDFFAESLIFAETANAVGAIQVAGSTQITQTPFFIAACDYVLIGDEFYAASAYLNREPVLVGSLVGQDWSKGAIFGLIVIGFLLNNIQSQIKVGEVNLRVKDIKESSYDQKEVASVPSVEGLKDNDKVSVKLNETRLPKPEEFFIYKVFNPEPTDALDIKREKKPAVAEGGSK